MATERWRAMRRPGIGVSHICKHSIERFLTSVIWYQPLGRVLEQAGISRFDGGPPDQ